MSSQCSFGSQIRIGSAGRRDRIVAVVAPQHSLAKGRAPSVRARAESPSILREPGSGTREIVERAFARRLVERKTAGLALERPLYSLKLRGRHLSRSALAFLEDFDQGQPRRVRAHGDE
jgi:LysR substrate binding domain